MPPATILDIPEVTALVASFLESKDFARCVRVSKSWRAWLLPHLWKVIETRRSGPHPTDIYRHRHLIQVLSLYDDSAGLDKYHYHYPHLRELTVAYSRNAVERERKVSLEFTEMFPFLVEVTLSGVNMEGASWSMLSAHPHISKLDLYFLSIDAADAPEFWRACSTMESLRLCNITTKGNLVPADVIFSRLRALYLCGLGSFQDELDLTIRCPLLRELEWDAAHEDTQGLPLFKDCEYWPHLNNLTILYTLRDPDLVTILEGVGKEVGGLTHLCFECCYFKEKSHSALGRRFSTLVELNLEGTCPSSMLQEILCSCPRLELLYGGDIFASDIVEGGPWICQRLRELKFCVRVEESERNLQPEIFKRISALVGLEELNMRYPEVDDTETAKSVLEFRLDQGFGQLASLRQLRTLVFDDDGIVTNTPHGRGFLDEAQLEETEGSERKTQLGSRSECKAHQDVEDHWRSSTRKSMVGRQSIKLWERAGKCGSSETLNRDLLLLLLRLISLSSSSWTIAKSHVTQESARDAGSC
ncbi:hypothetical protein B0O80DRAFT_47673 [Mortierella sp. GBAus27b]|nr:hypothetical protein B0O80DRAFT_47673 [Mortierella sp. GBAus27b]